MNYSGSGSQGGSRYRIAVPIDVALAASFDKAREAANLQAAAALEQAQRSVSVFIAQQEKFAEQVGAISSLTAQLQLVGGELQASLRALQDRVWREVSRSLHFPVSSPELPSIETICALGESVKDNAELLKELPSDEDLGPELSEALESLNQRLRATGELLAECADIGIRLLYRIFWCAVILFLAGHAPAAIILFQAMGFAPDNLDAWARSLSSSSRLDDA